MMSDLVSPFQAFLKQHGYQLTSERVEIAQVVGTQRRIFTTEELMAQLKEAGCHQSRGTVYSTVRLLAESGLILQLPQSSEARYLTSEQASLYAVCRCRCCGAEVLYRQPRRLKALHHATTYRYRLAQPLLIFYGVCHRCESDTAKTNNKRLANQAGRLQQAPTRR